MGDRHRSCNFGGATASHRLGYSMQDYKQTSANASRRERLYLPIYSRLSSQTHRRSWCPTVETHAICPSPICRLVVVMATMEMIAGSYSTHPPRHGSKAKAARNGDGWTRAPSERRARTDPNERPIEHRPSTHVRPADAIPLRWWWWCGGVVGSYGHPPTVRQRKATLWTEDGDGDPPSLPRLSESPGR